MGPRNRESMGWEKLEKPRQSVRTQAIEHVGRTAVTGGGYNNRRASTTASSRVDRDDVAG
jgi:hypothetical protein